MPPNVKNQTNAKISKGEAFASSIRPAIRKPSKPATPNTVTASSAMEAVRISNLRPIPFPIRSTLKDGRDGIGNRVDEDSRNISPS